MINNLLFKIAIVFFGSYLIILFYQIYYFNINSSNLLVFCVSVLTFYLVSKKFELNYDNPFIFYLLYCLSIINLPLFVSIFFQSTDGLWYILISVFLFALGYFSLEKKKKIFKLKIDYNNFSKSYYLFFLSLVFAFSSFIILFNELGYSFFDLINFPKLFAISKEMSDLRYHTSYQHSNLFYVLFSFSFVSVFFGGYFYSFSNHFIKKKKLLIFFSFLAMLPLVYNLIIKNQRTSILFGVLIFFSTFLSSEVYLGKVKKINVKNLFYAILVISVLLCIYYIFQIVRLNENNFFIISQHLISAIIGSIVSFDEWFYQAKFSNYLETTYGEYTVNRIHYYITNKIPNVPGLFGDVTWLGNNYRTGTTIYTIYRSLITDFSIYGSFLFFIFFGYSTCFCYQELKGGNIVFLPIMSLIYFFILFGYLTSVLNWNSIILTYFIVIIFFFIIKISLLHEKS